jgi:DNA repair exonuclease SbcCD nuclease subunit
MNITILNDVHLGAVRSGGTTPTTAWQLRQDLLDSFEQLVAMVKGDLLILGDLFDTANVPMADLLRTWEILRKFCAQGGRLFLVAGNHDLSKTASTLSSFQFLCELLHSEFGPMITKVFEPLRIDTGVHVIPHLPNQDLFDAALALVPDGTEYLLLHCNYNNGFAAQSDHSLNLSQEQAMACPARRIIIAHEHQRKEFLGGKVQIIGNQIPSSIADCLGNEVKYMAVVQDSGFSVDPVWVAKGSFIEIDWRSLTQVPEPFVRVVGSAEAAEAAEVVSAIARYRNKSESLVITNAVQIAGIEDEGQIKLAMTEVKAFDVLGALLEHLDERERGVVTELLKAKEAA